MIVFSADPRNRFNAIDEAWEFYFSNEVRNAPPTNPNLSSTFAAQPGEDLEQTLTRLHRNQVKSRDDYWNRAMEELHLQVALLETSPEGKLQTWAAVIKTAAEVQDAVQLKAALDNATDDGVGISSEALAFVSGLCREESVVVLWSELASGVRTRDKAKLELWLQSAGDHNVRKNILNNFHFKT